MTQARATNGIRQIKASHLVLATVGAIVAVGGLFQAMLTEHAAHPHRGAVTESELALIKEMHETEMQALSRLMTSEHAALRQQIEALRTLMKRD